MLTEITEKQKERVKAIKRGIARCFEKSEEGREVRRGKRARVEGVQNPLFDTDDQEAYSPIVHDQSLGQGCSRRMATCNYED